MRTVSRVRFLPKGAKQMKILSRQTAALLSAGALLLLLSACAGSDRDKDGIPNGADMCAEDSEDIDGFEDNDGCPDPDNDKDGVCDPWVAEKGLSAKYKSVCTGSDKCLNEPEDKDGFEDDDGCAELDNDKDGIPDKFDKCPNDAEDKDGFQDNDGCPDVDNDGDGVCDEWVSKQGLSAKYKSVCIGADKCPNDKEDMDDFEDGDGCPDADNDKDGIPDQFDKCPNAPGGANTEDGCPAELPGLADETELALRFETGDSTLTFEDREMLNDKVATLLANHPEDVVYVFVFMPQFELEQDEYLAILNGRSRAIKAFLVSKGAKESQIKIRTVTPEIFEKNKGGDQDFSQSRPVLVKRKK